MTRLRAAREAANLTQAQMAASIGVSESLYRALESGRALPSPRVAGLLSDALGEKARRLLEPAKIDRIPRLRADQGPLR